MPPNDPARLVPLSLSVVILSLSETKSFLTPQGNPMKYKVTFVDDTKAKIKASSKEEAKQRAESKEGKPVSKVREYGEET
jgi:hypothetical protein